MTEQELKAKTASVSDITKLPDGSAFFTATIMSQEEAMKLPPEKRPICFRLSSEMYHAVFEAIGAASMCWKPRPGSEVFSSEEASKVAVDLCFKVAKELETIKDKLEAAEKERDEASARCAEILHRLRQAAKDAYRRGCEICKKPECLGEDWKMENGKFGKPEREAHKLADMQFGFHYLAYEFLRELPSDCGKDFVRKSEVAPIGRAFAEVIETIFTYCGRPVIPGSPLHRWEQALTLARKLGIK